MHAPVSRDRAFGRAANAREGTCAIIAPGAADVDFIGLDRLLRCRRARRVTRVRRLSGVITVATSSSPRPGVSPAGPSMPPGSATRLAQHLVAAADPEHLPAAATMRGEIDVPALRAQEVEIAAGGFRARAGSRARRRPGSLRPAAPSRGRRPAPACSGSRSSKLAIRDSARQRDLRCRPGLRASARVRAHPRPAALARDRKTAARQSRASRCAPRSSRSRRRTARDRRGIC